MSRSVSAPPVRAAAADVHLTVAGDDLHLVLDTRRYRIRGLEKNLSLSQMRVNLLAARDELVHLDTLDLYQARSRASFIRAAASELYVDEAVIKRDLGRILLALEEIQQQRSERATGAEPHKVELTPAQQEAALMLLRDPQLLERILADYDTCGLVGEHDNKLLCYLACTSRLLPQPLALLVQSGSAAGKTSLMDATLALMPPEEAMRYSAMTGQSLYYMGSGDLRHKILAVAEEGGVRQASYALKLLQSDGRLRIAAASKNRGTGRQETEVYEVQGPVMMLLTTTNQQPDPELENRCLVLHVSETPAQTASIHARQRAAYTLGVQTLTSQQQALRTLHQNAQRMLRRLPVVIPQAERLSFRNDQTHTRRGHASYLSLIAASALLHQYQRRHHTIETTGLDQPTEYIEAALEDILLANRLFASVMGQHLDSLLPQTRQLLVLLDDYVSQLASREQKPRQQIRFTQRALREALGWGDLQLRRHLTRLVQLEYVLVYRRGAANQREYALIYDGQGRSGKPFVLGLADPAAWIQNPSAAGIDHLPDRNDGPPITHRSASAAPSMSGENGASTAATKRLHGARANRAPKEVKPR